METRDIVGQNCGKIWHRSPSPAAYNGVVVCVTNSGKITKHGHVRRFLHASFDSSAEQVIASDHLGGVFMFDIAKNRFSIIQSCGQCCTAIAMGLRRQHEYLVGLADSSVKCFTAENKELVSWMRGHESAVHSISVHESGRYAITTSRDTAQMWNLDTFERMRKLNIKSQTPIQQVFFLPRSDTILTCFADDTIFGWESESFMCRFKLANDNQHSFGYKTFAVTRNGKTLVCGGKSNLLHVYSLQTRKLLHVIKLPSTVQAVKQLDFLVDKFDSGENMILGVLSQDGIVRFLRVDSCHVLFDIQAPHEGDKVTGFCTHKMGSDYIVALTEQGCFVIYSIKALSNELNKAPGPLVKVVKDIWKRKAFADKQDSTSSSRAAQRPLDGSMTTGRIWCRKLKQEPVETEGLLPNGLSMPRLLRVVRWFGEYPETYRLFIWRSILQLPENQAAFTSLQDKGTHLAYAALQEKFPVKSGKLLRVMERVLSALAHWSAIFAELDYLPLVAFPFIKLFQNNALICFEVIATVLTNWCQHWFEFFPNPPINMLSMVENLLGYHDKELLQHFVKYEVTTQTYAWPLLQTLMSEVLTRNEWLRLFDNVFSNHPSFLLYCVVSYSVCCRSALLKTNQLDDFKYFYHHRNALDIRAVINEAYRMSECTPTNIDPKKSLEAFQPLESGVTYPIFNKYPKFIVDYQANERERIRRDELDYLREKHIAQELSDQMMDRKLHEEAWYRKKEMLEGAEEERRRILMEEETKLIGQRKKLAAMKRELRIRELQLLDKSRMRFVDHQQTMKQIEINRLEEELRRKMRLREQEVTACVEDVEVKGLELEAHRATLEQEMARQQSELEDVVRCDVDRRLKLQEMEEHMHSKLHDNEIDLKETKALEEQLASSQLKENALSMQTEMASRLLHNDIEREKDLARSLSKNIDHLRQQKHLNERLRELRQRKDSKVEEQRDRLRCLELMRNDGDERRAQLLEDENLEDCRRRIKESERRMEDHMDGLRRQHDRLRFEERENTFDAHRMTAIRNAAMVEEIPAQDVEWSINRERSSYADDERQLMDDVRQLRQRLVSQRRAPLH